MEAFLELKILPCEVVFFWAAVVVIVDVVVVVLVLTIAVDVVVTRRLTGPERMV